MQDLDVYHRTESFYEDFLECRQLLAPFFGAQRLPLLLTASGSGAMEAAVTNFTNRDDSVLVVVGGKFGERWLKLCQAFGCKIKVLNVAWGNAPTPDEVTKQAEGTRAVFFQANETSTGAFFPVEGICRSLRSSGYNGTIVVDAISALCAHPIAMDNWGIDCVVSGSQKGFGVPPGLAFVGLSERADSLFSTRERFYFDLRLELKGQAGGRSAFTPAISLILGLKTALHAMHQGGGIQAVFDHHLRLATAARASCYAMNLKLFAEHCPSNALTAMTVPAGIDGSQLLKSILQNDDAILAGGQDELKGKIVRLAHLGFIDRLDLVSGIAALEFGLQAKGHKFELGAGVAAAMAILK
jgi:aspartate aminotransferase-like enzyme